MSTPTPNIWTINAGGVSGDGQKLVGCHIKFDPGTGTYTFTKPNNDVKSTYTPPTPTPSPAPTSFTFPEFTYKDKKWDVSVNLPLTSGVNGSGNWTIVGNKVAFATPPPIDPQSGEYTAQAGSGLGEGEDAISANA